MMSKSTNQFSLAAAFIAVGMVGAAGFADDAKVGPQGTVTQYTAPDGENYYALRNTAIGKNH